MGRQPSRRYANRKARGLCVSCGAQVLLGAVDAYGRPAKSCDACRASRRERGAASRRSLGIKTYAEFKAAGGQRGRKRKSVDISDATLRRLGLIGDPPRCKCGLMLPCYDCPVSAVSIAHQRSDRQAWPEPLGYA